MKNSDKDLEGSWTTKLDWDKSYKETWYDQIMLSAPRKFCALDSCFYFDGSKMCSPVWT